MVEPNGLKVEVGGSPLKAIRDLLDVSQQQFASDLGIAVSTVSRWERGQGTPMFTPGQFKTLLSMLERKGVELDDLPDDWSLTKN
ncbi:MAG: helix-turn-helix domain-containing protein [Cyanobacteria bacterium P01_D01_bin.36]